MGRQLGIHHGHGQPRGIAPPGEERHESTPFPGASRSAGRAGRASRQTSAHEFRGLQTFIGIVYIGHRVGDVGLRDAHVPELAFQGAAGSTPPPPTTPHPFRSELRVVDQAPHPDAVDRLVDRLCRVFLLGQAPT